MSTKTKQRNLIDLYNELKENLIYPLLIYIPLEVVVEELDQQTIDSLIENGFPFERILYVRNSLDSSLLNKDSNLSDFITKNDYLKENFFAIAQYEEILLEKNFNRLLKMYLDIANTYHFFSNIFTSTFSLNKNQIIEKFNSYFLMQEELYCKHLEDLYFAYPQFKTHNDKHFNLLEFINAEFVENDSHTLNIQETKSTRKKAKREKLINDEESTIFLLKNVFNVEM